MLIGACHLGLPVYLATRGQAARLELAHKILAAALASAAASAAAELARADLLLAASTCSYALSLMGISAASVGGEGAQALSAGTPDFFT